MKRVSHLEDIKNIEIGREESEYLWIACGGGYFYKMKDGRIIRLKSLPTLPHRLDIAEVVFFEDEESTQEEENTTVLLKNKIQERLQKKIQEEVDFSMRLSKKDLDTYTYNEVQKRAIEKIMLLIRVSITDAMLGKTRKESNKPQNKEKEPWRPHYIVKSLLIASGLYTFAPSGLNDGDLMKIINIEQAAAALGISNAELKDLANGFKDIDHVSAYRLSKAIKDTDVRFWMDLQERYDEYERGE
jgi:hypothetical protein